MKKTIIALLILVSGIIPATQAVKNNNEKNEKNEIWKERRLANLYDVTFLTITAGVIGEYLQSSSSIFSFLKCIGYGTTAWLSGEFAEMIYKKIYKKLMDQNLRDGLGTTTILGVKIDNQRLVRRVISVGIVYYLVSYII